MLRSKIIGTGSFLPVRSMDNAFLSTIVDTSDAWIRERTGICSRHIAANETTVSMGTAAAKDALAMAGLAAGELDLILLATFTPDYIMPNTACLIQAELGAAHAFCFDINAACSGFLYALQTADAYIRCGMCKNALVIGSETISRTIDWKDRSTCILFGDGAGAVVLSSSSDDSGFLDFLSGSDGSRGSVLELKNRALHNPYHILPSGQEPGPYLSMNGQEVFKFAVRKVPEMILSITERNHLSLTDIRHYILHQANERIIHAVAKRLNLPEDRFPVNLSECGNTSAASIPILLHECNQNNIIKQEDFLILSGFGGGLTWSSALLKW